MGEQLSSPLMSYLASGLSNLAPAQYASGTPDPALGSVPAPNLSNPILPDAVGPKPNPAFMSPPTKPAPDVALPPRPGPTVDTFSTPNLNGPGGPPPMTQGRPKEPGGFAGTSPLQPPGAAAGVGAGLGGAADFDYASILKAAPWLMRGMR